MTAPRVQRACQMRDGRLYVVREGRVADARQIIAHTRGIMAEPQWNVTESGEFQTTHEQEEAWILSFQQRPHNLLLVADFGTIESPQITGVLNFNTQNRFRMRHRGRLGISVNAAYRGQGVGEALMHALLDWATAEPELERIELSVFAHNTRAFSLYVKMGFHEEARLLRAFKLSDGIYYDEIMMVKWVK